MSIAVGTLCVGNWTSLFPSPVVLETACHLMSGMIGRNCAELNLHDGDVLLRGQLTGTYNTLLVTITMATFISFGPGPGQPACHPMTSSMLTHHESGCSLAFCAVPTTCRYLGNKAVSRISTLWQYDFFCVCTQPVCNELLLWFHQDSVQDQLNMVSLCEVDVSPLWLWYHILRSLYTMKTNY